MADNDTQGTSGITEGIPETPKKGVSKLILFGGIGALLLLVIGSVIFFTHFGRDLAGLDKKEEKPKEQEIKEAYYDIPDLLVNLNGPQKRASFLKLSVILTYTNEKDKERLDAVKPRIIDQFQMYLRELEPQDLRGSAGLQRLREELLHRVNTVTAPVQIKDILFKEMLIQ